MARIVDFADGAQSETTPTIGNIIASGIITYPDDATYEATEQNAPQLGNIYYNTTTNFLRYYTGAGWIDIVDDEQVQTLINKTLEQSTIDADQNTITNIADDEIKAGAAIDVTKLHDGSVDNTEFGHLDGVTSNIQTQLDAKQNLSEKGAANGYAELDATGKVPVSQLPLDDVDNVDEFADFASFPPTGVTDRIYIAADTNVTYRWTGSQYIQVGSSVEELSDLTDVDTTGVQDGEILQYNQANSQFEPVPFDPNTIVQENIALVGKGTAAWSAAPVGNTNVAESLTDTNDFAIGSNIRGGFTFTPSSNGELAYNVGIFVDRGLGNGDGTIQAFLYATSGGVPTGTALDSSTVWATSNLTNATNTETSNNFIFSGNVQLDAGTEYAIVYESSDTGTLYARRGNVNETFSQNVVEDSADSDTYSLAPVQETLYFRVFFDNVPGGLTLNEDMFLSVPPLANDRHTIQAQTLNLGDGQCAYVSIDRQQASATNLAVTIDDITNVTPDNNIIIIARVDGTDCYFGLKDLQRIPNGETVDVQVGGGGFSPVFQQNTIETKTLNSNATSNGPLTDLTFTGLTIGKWYEITGKVAMVADQGTNDTTVQLDIIHDGITLDRPFYRVSDGADVNNDFSYFGVAAKFQATTTSLTFEGNSLSTNSYIVGNNNRTATYIQLEERNDLDTNVVENNDLNQQTVNVSAEGNGSTSLTANVSNIDWVEVSDEFNSWDGTTFTAPASGYYEAKGISVTAGSVTSSIRAYVNGVYDRLVAVIISRDTGEISWQGYLNEGDELSFRYTSNVTLSNIIEAHWLEINSMPDFTTYGVVNPETEYIEVTDSSNVSLGTTFGTFHALNPAWTITLQPGTWDIEAQASIGHNANAGRAFASMVLSTESSAGSVSLANIVGSTSGTTFSDNSDEGGYQTYFISARDVVITSTTTFYLYDYGSNLNGASNFVVHDLRNDLGSAVRTNYISARRVK